ISCTTDKKEKLNKIDSITELKNDVVKNTSKGYELMTQKCFICHFEKPDPSRKDQMLAPPFLRVQEHYKPTYPNKEGFIAAVMDIINNPSVDKTLMPGAVKKFNLMPKIVYDQTELRLIVETLYDMDYGDLPKMKMKLDLTLNDGEKWKLSKNSIEQINEITTNLNNFNATDISAYNNLGKDIFDDAKMIMLDESYTGELWEQIHVFFSGVEDNMHSLISAKSIDKAEGELTILKVKFDQFYDYFE
ncbi:MAG: hypothetical protein QM478_13780, partial [Flavobacteriaceae bacterium]